MTLIHKYATDNDLVNVQLELEKGIDINMKAPSGETSLHRAARAGHVEMVQFLLEKGTDIYIQETRANRTPLHEAVSGLTLRPQKREDYYQIFQLLLEQESNLRQQYPERYQQQQLLKDIKDKFNDTPLKRLGEADPQARQKLLEIIQQVEKRASAIKPPEPAEINLGSVQGASHRYSLFNDSLRRRRKGVAASTKQKHSHAINHEGR